MAPLLKTMLCLMIFALPGWAHHPDPTANPNIQGSGPFAIGGGVLFPFEHGNSPSVLVSVEYRGHNVETGDHHVSYRYFWVSAQTFLNLRPHSHSHDSATADHHNDPLIESVMINVAPVTKIKTGHDGTTKSVRYLPIEVSRTVDIGLNGSVKVQAIGWAYYNEQPMIGETVSRFAHIAVDLVGLRYASIMDRGPFVGAQVGSINAAAGLNWRHTEQLNARFSVGVRGGLAGGELTSADQVVALAQSDFFARIETTLARSFGRVGAFAEGGHHVFEVLDDESHSAGHSHGHGYLMVGLTYSF